LSNNITGSLDLKRFIYIFQPASDGFTLVETLVGTTIMAIVALGGPMGLSSGTQAVLQSDKRTTAVSLANSQMEAVKTASYFYSPTGGASDYSGIMVGIPAGYQIHTLDRSNTEQPNTVYGIPWDVNSNDVYSGSNPIDPGLQKVTVIIRFQNQEIFRLIDLKINQ
jgi:prepilin-type N-terminal cleavage/methylation domain-containing protein